jgi:hypothetical protein
MKTETYPRPADGWVCFHCGERFTTPGAAEDHFGAQPNQLAGCQIKAGEERGLLMELRRAEKDREFLYQLLDDIDTVSDAAKGDDAGYRRAVQRIQARKSEVGESPDGYTMNWKHSLAIKPTPLKRPLQCAVPTEGQIQ